MTYKLLDYVGDRSLVLKSIKTATEKPRTRQGQAAIRMLNKRYFKNYKETANMLGLEITEFKGKLAYKISDSKERDEN